MVDSNDILEYLRQNKPQLFQEYHLVKIGLLGSFARDENGALSNIDLRVEFGTPNLYAIKWNLKKEVQSKFNRPVDICRGKYIKPIFRKQIISETKYV